MPTRTEQLARSLNRAVARASLGEILRRLKSMRSEKNREGMKRYGINAGKGFGISGTDLRRLAKEVGRNHELSLQLWNTGYYEARLLAALVGEAEKVTPRQMEAWVKQFDSWDVCDGVCGNLFDRTPFAFTKAAAWARRVRVFEKRAGFALMAWLTVHQKSAPDKSFEKFLPIIRHGATDERPLVKKAVSWALRQIGKRNKALNKKAIALAREMQNLDSSTARWIARDALKELQSNKVQKRLTG